MCKQLFFRLKDIESEKGSIIKEIHKEKEMEAKKYKDILRKLKGVKESNPIHAWNDSQFYCNVMLYTFISNHIKFRQFKVNKNDHHPYLALFFCFIIDLRFIVS